MVNPMDLGWFFHGSTQREVTIGLRPGSTRRVERGEGLLVLLLGWWKTHGNHGEIMGQCWAINHGFNDGPEGFSDGFFLMGFSGSVNHDGLNFGWSGFSDGFFWFCESWWVNFWLKWFFLMRFSGSVNHDGSNFGWSGFSDGYFWFC